MRYGPGARLQVSSIVYSGVTHGPLDGIGGALATAEKTSMLFKHSKEGTAPRINTYDGGQHTGQAVFGLPGRGNREP